MTMVMTLWRGCWAFSLLRAAHGMRVGGWVPRRAALAGIASAPSVARAGDGAEDAAVAEALRQFTAGDYEKSLAAWRDLTTRSPRQALYWSNRGTVELILGSKESTLGVAPTGAARELLEASVASLSTSVDLRGGGESDDALSLNNLGNAHAVLLRWDAAARCYDRSLDAALARDRSFASIPASNRAQAALELGDAGDAERRTLNLLRRDPNFVDGRALLAAIRFAQGSKRVIQRRFNVGVLEATPERKASTL